MKRIAIVMIGLFCLVGRSEAEVALMLDGQLLTGVENVIYDAGQKRFAVSFSAGPRCSQPVMPPDPDQLFLSLVSQEYPVVGEIVYQSGPAVAVLSISTGSAPVACLSDALFSDRFELPG